MPVAYAEDHLQSLSPTCLPSETLIIDIVEQLGEQWTMETDLETISYRPQQSTTNTHPHSHCSPTSDYETDSLDKDSDLIITLTSSQAHSTSTTVNTTSTQALIPIVYFLDALAVHPPAAHSTVTHDFLVTLGFGRDTSTMRATWINRSIERVEHLPTLIHHDGQKNDREEILSSLIEDNLHYATEKNLEDDHIATIIYPHRLQFGHDFGENIEGPLVSFYEPGYLHLPVVDEVTIFDSNETSFDESLEHSSTNIVAHERTFLTSDNYQLKAKTQYAFGQIEELIHHEEYPRYIPLSLVQPTYIDRYHIQSLQPMVELHSPPVIYEHQVVEVTRVAAFVGRHCSAFFSLIR